MPSCMLCWRLDLRIHVYSTTWAPAIIIVQLISLGLAVVCTPFSIKMTLMMIELLMKIISNGFWWHSWTLEPSIDYSSNKNNPFVKIISTLQMTVLDLVKLFISSRGHPGSDHGEHNSQNSLKPWEHRHQSRSEVNPFSFLRTTLCNMNEICHRCVIKLK